MDIISNNKTMKKKKKIKSKRIPRLFVVALKRAVLEFSCTFRTEKFLFCYKFVILLGCQSRS